MSSNPFLSIIVATYNAAEHIDGLAASINSQSFTNYEVLISDGGSTDGSNKYFNSTAIKNLAWFKSTADKGIYYALNEALTMAQGDWIFVMGADDRFIDENALKTLKTAIDGLEADAKVIYTDLQIKSKTGVRFKLYPEYSLFKNKYQGCPPLHHQTVYIKKECIKMYGNFNTKYKIHADYDYFCRLMLNEIPVKVNISILSYNDSGFSSNWKNLVQSINEITAIRLKHNAGKVGYRIYFPYLRIIVNKLLPIVKV